MSEGPERQGQAADQRSLASAGLGHWSQIRRVSLLGVAI